MIQGMGAGAGKFGLFLADITPEEWANHMNLNVNSVLFLTQLATPLLEASTNFPSLAMQFKSGCTLRMLGNLILSHCHIQTTTI